MPNNEEFVIIEKDQQNEEFEVIEKTYFSEPFWNKVVNKNQKNIFILLNNHHKYRWLKILAL